MCDTTDEIKEPKVVSYHRAFQEEQTEYFSDILERKWSCDLPGHNVCVITEDQHHHELSEKDLAVWVDALCLGKATTSQPPEGVLMNGKATTYENSFTAVSIPPSRRRNIRSPALAATASLRESLEKSWVSEASSGIPGPGYLSGKAVKWLGQKGLNMLEAAVITKRAYGHMLRLKLWERYKRTGAGLSEISQRQLLKMLEEALEMSRPCYSHRVNKYATTIGSRLESWTIEQDSDGQSSTSEKTSLAVHIRACLPPLLLGAPHTLDMSTRDLAWDLLDAITRVPLALRNGEDASFVICILGRELAYAPYTPDHPALGRDLFHILHLASRTRSFTRDEMSVLHAMAIRRQKLDEDELKIDCRPWELEIFSQCALQDPWFEEAVLGPRGQKTLFSVLSTLLSKEDMDPEEEGRLRTHLHTCYWISLLPCVAPTVEARTITLLLDVIRKMRGAQEEWFLDCCNAIAFIDHTVSRHPPLLDTLSQMEAEPVLSTFVAAPIPLKPTAVYFPYAEETMQAVQKLLQQMKDLPADGAAVSHD